MIEESMRKVVKTRISPSLRIRRDKRNCEQKVAHHTFESAVQTIIDLAVMGEDLGEAQPYVCRVCGWWHWGRHYREGK